MILAYPAAPTADRSSENLEFRSPTSDSSSLLQTSILLPISSTSIALLRASSLRRSLTPSSLDLMSL
ncbi:MAG: hypothetical protein JHC24_01160 [Thaumarchaeota archaeon]|nr:hypothetical protein [Nitrososphaerota archaeon]